MSNEITILATLAASMGFIHTLIGPDHYLPFIMMSKARGWSLVKTIWITLGCGVGHVLSSVVIGLAGVALGIGVGKLESIEAVRGNIAAWALITFGLVYAIWGLRQALRKKGHMHTHLVGELAGVTHTHFADADDVHTHQGKNKPNITPWVLFTVFVLGPCEPLIPILMYPAAKHSMSGVLFVTLVFGIVTIATMIGVVVVSSLGLKTLPFGRLDRYSHAIAGSTIALSGLAIQFLGL